MSAYNKMTYCRDCGGMIVFVRTAAGRMMPCDTPSVPFMEDYTGGDKLMGYDGVMVDGYILKEPREGSTYAYVPHFHTCKPKSKDEYKPRGIGPVKESVFKTAAVRAAEEKLARLQMKQAPSFTGEQLCMFAEA